MQRALPIDSRRSSSTAFMSWGSRGADTAHRVNPTATTTGSCRRPRGCP